jgi:hypothetical protein
MFRGRINLGNTELGEVIWQLSIPQIPELVFVAFRFSPCPSLSLCLSLSHTHTYTRSTVQLYF